MTSAAFSASSGSPRRISIHNRRTKPATATATAADEAIRQVIDRRRRRNRGDFDPDPPGSPLGGAIDFVSDVFSGVTGQLGVPQRAVRTTVFVTVAALLAWSVIGLRQSGPPVPVHPASARVLFGQTVPVGAQVVLHPRAGVLPREALPQGTVQEDGTVVFSTYAPWAGVPAGEYVATIQWFRVSKNGSVGGNVLPPRYGSPVQSPLSIAVSASRTDPIALHIGPK
jgi:hypothetical protein